MADSSTSIRSGIIISPEAEKPCSWDSIFKVNVKYLTILSKAESGENDSPFSFKIFLLFKVKCFAFSP